MERRAENPLRTYIQGLTLVTDSSYGVEKRGRGQERPLGL